MLTVGELQELLDKQGLADNLMPYCRGVDRMDTDLIRSVSRSASIDDDEPSSAVGLMEHVRRVLP